MIWGLNFLNDENVSKLVKSVVIAVSIVRFVSEK